MINYMSVRLVQWPLKMKRSHGVGDIAVRMPGVILELRTTDGRTGWGEAAPWSVFSGTAEAAFAALDVYLRPMVVGRSDADRAVILAEADDLIVAHPEAKMALDMALHDLAGKRLGCPVVELLGGALRTSIPLSVSIANPDFEADIDFAHARLAEGVRLFKVKTGFADHATDLVRLARLREILPADADMRVDYNQGLEPFGALARLRDIEAFRPSFIEQPVAREHRRAMGELQEALTTPILADESVFSPDEAAELARERYARAVSIKLMKAGSFAKARAIAAIVGAAGIPAYGGTMYEGGIALAAGIHSACAMTNLTLGAEFYTANHVMAVDILTKPLDLAGGLSHLPAGPGLGVEIDLAALAGITELERHAV
jgi:muconate cycloisomerase